MTSSSMSQQEDDKKQEPSSRDNNHRKVSIVFLHLDLGIGGAEQLVLQLATASQALQYHVDLVTTRCDNDHCFAAVKRPDGILSQNVYIYGAWIPPTILGMATALMSTLRVLYLGLSILCYHKTADLVVVDVLPTSLPLLCHFLPQTGLLFYCHFPDQLLLQSKTQKSKLQTLYRYFLDTLEETTMGYADTLVVNSKFTLEKVQNTFSKLTSRDWKVLYPALDTSNMVQANDRPKTSSSPFVSLNRFQRKKNIGLVIRAYAHLLHELKNEGLPPLIIAGGYDTQNVENVQHRAELQQLAESLKVPIAATSTSTSTQPKPGHVTFQLDISDAERATLFQTALCVVYTPDQEHFGIVPLEAMFAGTPVLAVNSGGPLETIVDEVTGFLRDATPEAFGQALQRLWQDPALATTMGQAGREHVQNTFGTDRFQTEWKILVEQTLQDKRKQRRELSLWSNTIMYLLEALIALILVWCLTWMLRVVGVLGSTQSLFGGIKASLTGEEL